MHKSCLSEICYSLFCRAIFCGFTLDADVTGRTRLWLLFYSRVKYLRFLVMRPLFLFSGEGAPESGHNRAGFCRDIRHLLLSAASLHDLVLLQVSWKSQTSSACDIKNANPKLEHVFYAHNYELEWMSLLLPLLFCNPSSLQHINNFSTWMTRWTWRGCSGGPLGDSSYWN